MLLHFIAIFIETEFDLCLCHSLTYCCPVRLLEANRAAEELDDVVADIFCIFIRGGIWLQSQRPSARVYGNYSLIIAINSSFSVNNRTRSAAECHL